MRMLWLAVALAASSSSRPVLAQVAPGESACAALRQLQLPGAALAELTTEWFAAGSPPPPEPLWLPPLTVRMPAYCRVDATLDRRTGADGKSYGIGFALALSPAASPSSLPTHVTAGRSSTRRLQGPWLLPVVHGPVDEGDGREPDRAGIGYPLAP